MTDHQEMYVFIFVIIFVIILIRFQTPKSSLMSFRFDSPKSITEKQIFSNKPAIYGQGLGKDTYFLGQGLGKDPAYFEEIYNVDEGSGLFYRFIKNIFLF
jgi:hypothetical protein